jgi:hypothetical protein
MHGRRILMLLTIAFFWPAASQAQIVIQEKVGDKTIWCMHTGLSSTLQDCDTRSDWYSYVFVGVISEVTPAENDEKKLQIVPEEIFSGAPPNPLTVLTSQGLCMREMKAGDRWLFYLRKVEGKPIVLDYYGNDSRPAADAQSQIETLRRLKTIGNFGILRGGVVRGRDWYPKTMVANAKVTATRESDGTQSFCMTGADGRYEFPPLPPGHYKITAQPRDSYRPDDSGVDLESGSCRDVTLDGTPHALIGGMVRHADGSPAANVALVLIRSDNSWYLTTETNDDGHYAFDSQEPGKYVLGMNFPANPAWFGGGGAGASVRLPPASTFYPAAPNRSGAKIIHLATDQKLDHFDFTIPAK